MQRDVRGRFVKRGAGGSASVTIHDKDRGYEAMKARLVARGGTVSVGIHEEEGALRDGDVAMTNVEVGAFAEFGTATEPRRSFIVDWFDETLDRHRVEQRKVAEAVMKGQIPGIAIGLDRWGSRLAAEVKQRMAAGIPPALAQVTIDRKGSSTPLIDTNQLRGSITWKVNP